ncbi:MAG: nitroreductase family deazaflavin-dependent oxidoreductase [Anaerolineae bacterium]|nr:nitroreductase family deazaflavin-dependent oxidoreductase [Anaerolineae bacterium]
MNWQKVYNPFMKAVLRSPLHWLADRSTMLITYTGRKSGKEYCIPVNYVRDGDRLLSTSMADRVWWRNLRGGEPVQIVMKGKTYRGTGRVFEVEQEVSERLGVLARVNRMYARYLGIEINEQGESVNTEPLVRAAAGRVVVEIDGLEPL